MDTLLVAITALSLLIVLVLAVIVARLLRDERRRSEARVAALVALSGGEVEHARERVRPVPEPGVTSEARVAPQARVASQSPVAPQARVAPQPKRTNPIDEVELRPSRAAAAAPLFVQPERSAVWKPRLVIVAPLLLILVGAAIAFYPSQGEISAPEPPPVVPGNTVAQTAVPLELLSLKHTQASDSLTVTGVVQNPRTGAALSKVFATAFVFAADGTFLASGRAPLDFTTLAPGAESPFVVTVPVQGEVARYRVGFRDADGRVVGHVDRRTGGAIARVNE